MIKYRQDIGSVSISPDEPVQAGSNGTWILTYTAGEAGIQKGGKISFGIPHGFSIPVVDNNRHAGYCTAKCSRDGVHLVLRCTRNTSNALEHKAGVYGSISTGVNVHICEKGLEPGDQIEFCYGDRSEDGPGAFARNMDGPAVFTTLVSPTDTWTEASHFYFIENPPVLRVTARESDRIYVALPSTVRPGEKLTASITSRDEYENLAEASGIKATLDADDGIQRCPSEIQLNDTVEELDLEADGDGETARIRVKGPAGGEDLSNPVRVQKEGLNLYWGDMHCHTFASDGLRDPEEAYEIAKNVEKWDFAALADHDYMTDEGWDELQKQARKHNAEGDFVTFLGYEHSQIRGLHRNVYNLNDEGELVRTVRGEELMRGKLMGTISGEDYDTSHPSVETTGGLFENLDPTEHLVIPHIHRMDWENHDPRFEPVAEMYSCWGSREYTGCRYASVAPTRDVDTLQYALGMGHRLGFVGGGDGHAGRPGTDFWLRVRGARPCGITGIYAPELTRRSLWDALWARHCYATTGRRIIVQFYVNGAMMGEKIRVSSPERPRKVNATVNGTEKIERMTVVKNNKDVFQIEPDSLDAELDWKDGDMAEDGDYYYLRVEQEDGAMAWSSPIWIDK